MGKWTNPKWHVFKRLKEGRVQVGNSWGNVIWRASRLWFQNFTSKYMIFSRQGKMPRDSLNRSEDLIGMTLKNIIPLLVWKDSCGFRYPGAKNGEWVWSRCSRLSEYMWVIDFLLKCISNWNEMMVVTENLFWWQHKTQSCASKWNLTSYDFGISKHVGESGKICEY